MDTNLEFRRDYFPPDCLADCYHPGECGPGVEHWLSQIGLALDPADARELLRPWGAWSEFELLDHRANLVRILWLAAAELQESQEEIVYLSHN